MVSKPWTWITAAALLFAGLTNVHAHIHYCFDGQADPAAVHLVGGNDHDHALGEHEHGPNGHDQHDGDDQDADDHGAGHDDLDLDIPNPALAKVFKHDAPALPPGLFWAAVMEPAPATALAEAADLPPAPDPPHTRPETRGPPR